MNALRCIISALEELADDEVVTVKLLREIVYAADIERADRDWEDAMGDDL